MSSARPLSFAAVRDDIVSQHARLRVLLDQLDAGAERVVRADHCGPSSTDKLLDDLVRQLEDHMVFEEQALPAVSVSNAAWDAHELARLRREHQRQREELTRMTREAHGSDDPLSLALAIRAFVADVRLDMNIEEERLQRQTLPA